MVYVVYSSGMLLADYGGFDYETNNLIYLVFGVVHAINSCMYVWSWADHDWFDLPVLPEYINVLGAAIYLTSAVLYRYEGDDYTDPITMTVSAPPPHTGPIRSPQRSWALGGEGRCSRSAEELLKPWRWLIRGFRLQAQAT